MTGVELLVLRNTWNILTVCKQMSSVLKMLSKNLTNHVYDQDLALNNLCGLIHHETQPTLK